MSQIRRITFSERDIFQDNIVTGLARKAYDIFSPHYDLLSLILDDFNISTESISWVCRDIVANGLDRDTFWRLHSTLSSDWLSGKWREFVVVAKWREFVSPDTIDDEMMGLFWQEYDSVGKCLIFLIESLERIHPFVDKNRRMCSITMNLLLLRKGMMPLPWNKSRVMWEDPVLAPFIEDSKKRYTSIMQTIQQFYLQKIPQ